MRIRGIERKEVEEVSEEILKLGLVAVGLGGGSFGLIRLMEEGVKRDFEGIARECEQMRRNPDSEEVTSPGQTLTNKGGALDDSSR